MGKNKLDVPICTCIRNHAFTSIERDPCWKMGEK